MVRVHVDTALLAYGAWCVPVAPFPIIVLIGFV